MMRMVLATVLAALVIASPASAKTGDEGAFRQFREQEPIQLRPDRAYVLLRMDTDVVKFAADLLRVPSESELAAFQAAKKAAHDKAAAKSGEKAGPIESFAFDYEGPPNFHSLVPGKAIAKQGKVNTVLAELLPGDYVVYSIGMSYQCLCLGTVGFTAEPGKITDLGTMFYAKAADPSPIPELKNETGLGRSASMDYFLFAVGIRPATETAQLAPGIDRAVTSPARFRPVGAFVEPNVLLVNRLAAIPGVLDYREGRVIDPQTGEDVAN